MHGPLVIVDDHGLFCPDGGFHIDPWSAGLDGPLPHALLTHAHADHARPVMTRALVAEPGAAIARARLEGVAVSPLPYGEKVRILDVDVSLHPSGHVLGGAQIRIERVATGEVWVVSGDVKTAPDPTCAPFEPVRADVLIVEATFGVPLFRWDPVHEIFDDIRAWWREARHEGRAALVYAYALGKSARLLEGLRHDDVGHIFTHGAVENMLALYRDAGVSLPPTTRLVEHVEKQGKRPLPPGALVVAPPSAQGTPWARRLLAEEVATGFCSGWMRVRGLRRRRVVDRGFALSDHADWAGLLDVVRESGASKVLVTHGHTAVFAGALRERGLDAVPLETRFEGEDPEVGQGAEAVA